MAAEVTTTKTYTDDLADGAKLTAGSHVSIVLTDGQHTWTVDTARTNETAVALKAAGRKLKRRGRKASK